MNSILWKTTNQRRQSSRAPQPPIKRVTVHRGDGVTILRDQLLPRCKWTDYHRALCLLDPYDLSVPWTLVHGIGEMGSVEIFYTFMIMDANRNVLWHDPSRVAPAAVAKMDMVWGDRTWRNACYEQSTDVIRGCREKTAE